MSHLLASVEQHGSKRAVDNTPEEFACPKSSPERSHDEPELFGRCLKWGRFRGRWKIHRGGWRVKWYGLGSVYVLQLRVIFSKRHIDNRLKTGVHQASVSQRAQEIPHRPVRHASQRYRKPGSPDRVAQRTDWPIDGALQDAPERPRLAPRPSHAGQQAA